MEAENCYTIRDVESNRLQRELDRQRAGNPAGLIDLADTNFHANGLRFPDEPLRTLFDGYLRQRSYRPDSKGDPAARRAISEYYAAHSIEIPADRVIITASTSESYSLLFSSLAEVGDNVVLPRPTYPLFEYLVDYARLEPRYYDMTFDHAFRLDPETIRARIDRNTKFVVLISPNNPTGRVASADEIDGLLALCHEKGCMLIADEVFSELAYEGSPNDLTGDIPRAAARTTEVPIFTLNGISKMFGSPDLKLAWIGISGNGHGFDQLVDRLEIANDTFLNCSSLSQYLLPGLFAERERLTRMIVDRLAENRRQLLSVLSVAQSCTDRPLSGTKGIRIVVPTGGIHCVLGIPRSAESVWEDDEDFAVRLLRHCRLYVHPGYFYGLAEHGEESYIVISFLKERERLVEGLARLLSFV